MIFVNNLGAKVLFFFKEIVILLLFYNKAMNPDPRPTSTQAAFSGQQQPAAPRDPRRGRIVLPFDPQPVDLGTWTYEHKVGLCVMIIAYLVLGIIFVTTKLVVGGCLLYTSRCV